MSTDINRLPEPFYVIFVSRGHDTNEDKDRTTGQIRLCYFCGRSRGTRSADRNSADCTMFPTTRCNTYPVPFIHVIPLGHSVHRLAEPLHTSPSPPQVQVFPAVMKTDLENGSNSDSVPLNSAL